MIGRADRGGLGALTQEFHRQLHADRVLGIDLGDRGRGPADWSLFSDTDLVVNHGMDSDLDADLVRRFCDGLDVLYSAETFYRADLPELARSASCRTVLHVMPELWRADHAAPDHVWAPTRWEIGRLPAGTDLMPVPVARGRLPFRPRTECRVLYHHPAPAMLDRNGSRIVLAALSMVRSDLELVVVGAAGISWPDHVGHVKIRQIDPDSTSYHEVHPAEADVLVLPRRYAGLSLPMQETAAMGMGLLTLDLEPQRGWVPEAGLIPAYRGHIARFPGGEFAVHDANPGLLGRAIERLAQQPELVAELSAAADEHAAGLDWAVWDTLYLEALEAAAA